MYAYLYMQTYKIICVNIHKHTFIHIYIHTYICKYLYTPQRENFRPTFSYVILDQ
jgi:hypothetical protein